MIMGKFTFHLRYKWFKLFVGLFIVIRYFWDSGKFTSTGSIAWGKLSGIKAGFCSVLGSAIRAVISLWEKVKLTRKAEEKMGRNFSLTL